MVGDPNNLPPHSAADKPLGASTPSGGEESEGPPAGRENVVPGIPGPPSPDDNGAADSPLPEALLPEADTPRPDDGADASLREGDLCRGRVVGILPSGVAVDFGRKTEGLVAIEEFADGSDLPQLDDEIDVVFQGRGSTGDYASLSYQSARRIVLWEGIEQAHRQGDAVPARVVSIVRGGLGVDVGLPAFLPASQIDVRPPADAEALVGTDFPVRIVKFSRSRGNIVVSRRVLIEEEIQRRKAETLSKISLGAVVSGTVKNLTSYGVFVDLGGIDALLHITDLSYSRVNNPSDIVKVGESIRGKVIKFDPERERISLSLKAMEPDPWEGLEDRYNPGDRVSGRVTRTVEFGVFLEIEKGLEGLLHVGEISWSKRPPHPSKRFKVGQTVDCVVLKIESAKRRLSLSVRALTPDPWTTVAERYLAGTIVEGKVLSITSYGAFVELEEGIEGLVHVTDLTRDPRVRHPKELLKKGRSVQAVVLHVDEESKRVSLGIKQLEPDAWDDFFASHFVGDVIEARVLRRTSFGVFVEPAPGLEALCHSTELGGGGKRNSKGPTIGRVYQFRILDMDDIERRVRLSRWGLPAQEVKPAQEQSTESESGADAAKAAPKPRKSAKRKKSARKKKAATETESGDATAQPSGAEMATETPAAPAEVTLEDASGNAGDAADTPPDEPRESEKKVSAGSEDGAGSEDPTPEAKTAEPATSPTVSHEDSAPEPVRESEAGETEPTSDAAAGEAPGQIAATAKAPARKKAAKRKKAAAKPKKAAKRAKKAASSKQAETPGTEPGEATSAAAPSESPDVSSSATATDPSESESRADKSSD